MIDSEMIWAISETYGTAMDEKDIIKNAMAIRGYNQTSLAEELGYSHQSGVSQMLRAKSMSVDNFVMVLNKMGFDVTVVDRRDKKSGIEWKVAGGITRPRAPIPGTMGKKRGRADGGDTE